MISEVSHVDCIAIKIEVLLNKQSLCPVLAGFFVYLFIYDVHSEWKNVEKSYWDNRIAAAASLEGCKEQEGE